MLTFHPCLFLFVCLFFLFLSCLIRRKAYYLNEIDIVEVMLSTETTCISSVSLIHELVPGVVTSFVLGSCHDEHPDCDTFVMNGMCDQSIPFKEIFNVRELCKQSCGVCNRYVFLKMLE